MRFAHTQLFFNSQVVLMPPDGTLDSDGILQGDPPAKGNPGAGDVDSSSSLALLPVSCIGSLQPGDSSN